jgi:NitT/TauT family transport system ATP-binding protein
MSATLSFDRVSRRFQTRTRVVHALENVSIEVRQREFTALVGPSGCGKSTLLNIAAGLDTGFDGSFSLDPPKADRAYLFQSPRLLPWKTAQANVAFVLEARGASRSKARTAARHYLELVGLAGCEHQFPAHLSGGMRQRVALARALAVDPALMLMDEPFSALDEITAHRMRKELLEIHQIEPRTVLFVTHNLAEACFLADRVVVMASDPGRIVADVTIDVPRPREHDDLRLSAYQRELSRALFDHSSTQVSTDSPNQQAPATTKGDPRHATL